MPAWNAKRPPADYIHPRKKQRILAAHGHRCHICGERGDNLEIDHIIPWAEWTRTDLSPHDPSNLAPAHADCHKTKSEAERIAGLRRATAAKEARKRRPIEQHPGAIQ